MTMSRNCPLLLLALILIAVPMAAGAVPDTIYDDSVVYNLNKLAHKGSYSVADGDTVYNFNTTFGDDGWYTSTISSGYHHTVTFRFQPNLDDTYSIIAGDFINARVGSTKYSVGTDPSLQDPPEFKTRKVGDTDIDPYDLHDNITENCPWWSQEWSVESSQSNYLGKVRVDWKGESSFRDMCLFPYDILSTDVSYEDQTRTSTSGNENFNIGSPPYMVTVTWTYSSAT